MLRYLLSKYEKACRGKSKKEENPLPINVFFPLQALVDYKGLRLLVTLNTYQKDSQMVIGYNPNSEAFVYSLTTYSKTYDLVYKELARLLHAEPRIYDFEEKFKAKCLFPSFKIYHGPERSLTDFQTKERKTLTRSSKQAYDTDTAYIADVGILTPPEINFHYNPGVSMKRNLEEYSTGKFKIKHEMMFTDCTPFERWVFQMASETRTNRRINLNLLVSEPPEKIYDLSCINIHVDATGELTDINFNIKHLFDYELYKRPEIMDLAELTNKIFFEKIPQFLDLLDKHPLEVTDVRILLRMMASHCIDERHIGVIATNAKYPHIRDMCIEHMAAKSIAKLLAHRFFLKCGNVT